MNNTKILGEAEVLGEDDVVLMLRQRNFEKRTYGEPIEFVFQSSKKPSVNEFRKAIAAKLCMDESIGFEVVKYFPYEFSWRVISNEDYDNFREAKKKQDDKNNEAAIKKK